MYRSLAVIAALLFSAAAPRTTCLHAQAAATSTMPAPATPRAASAPTPLVPADTADGSAKTQSSEEEEKEDWTTIELAKSKLPLDSYGGFLLNKIEMAGGCTRELQRLQWRPGDPIDLYIVRPPQAERHSGEKLPVVLFLYNYTYDSDLFREDRWCELAKRNGYVTAGFASALSWQRFHTPRPLTHWFVSDMQEALAVSTHDVQMVLNYLASRGDLDMQHVGMFGQGSGGAIAILAAAADPRIGALDVMDPWGDWPDWLRGSKQVPDEERPAYVQPDFLQRVRSLDPVAYLPRLEGRPLRIQQLMTDPVTPVAARDSIANAAHGIGEVARYPDMAAETKALGANGIAGWLGVQVHAAGPTPPR